MIRQAEASKIQMTATSGNHQFQFPNFVTETRFNGVTANQHSSMVDENYIMIGSHIDLSLSDKIKRGEYVDFARLLPRDRMVSDENKLELVHKGGQTFFVPASECGGGSISNFYKWEQVFCVFSNIYLREHPERATELLQYNHVICMAAGSYQWDNVYQYDKEFRKHIGVYPDQSWGIILQQAWMLFLKDHINPNSTNYKSGGNGGKFHKKEACQCFNKGLCVTGRNCKYDHRCLECGKFGHGAHICRKQLQAAATSPQTSAQSNSSNNNNNSNNNNKK